MSKKLTRRDFIKISAVGLAATGTLVAIGRLVAEPPNMKLPDMYPVLPGKKPSLPQYNKNARFFNEHQYASVAALASIIVPTDEEPGATEAGVVDYIDGLVAGSKDMQAVYADGLPTMDGFSQRKHNKKFLDLEIKEQIDLLSSIDSAEAMRRRRVSNFIKRVDRKIDTLWDDFFGVGEDMIRFFRKVREHVFYGYYSNPVSWKVVRYYGPPQPVGYLDFAQPPSGHYEVAVRPVSDKACQHCHFDQTKKTTHKKSSECTKCHTSHFDAHGGYKNGKK